MSKELEARFELGHVVATRTVVAKVPYEDILHALQRHACGDWGQVDEQDRASNDDSLVNDGRLLSVYKSVGNVQFWIITEWDRSITTVLLPEDY